jgi:acetyl-CoA carboxylase biotin carboxyl carrier protein
MKTRNGVSSSPTLEELLDFAAESGLGSLVWEKGDRLMAFTRVMKSAPPPGPSVEAAPQAPAAPARPKNHIVHSPMVGTFHRSSKDRPPLVVEGSEVVPGQRLAVVEAMRVPRDVIADAAGRVAKVLLEDGHSVEYGQPLFELETGETA